MKTTIDKIITDERLEKKLLRTRQALLCFDALSPLWEYYYIGSYQEAFDDLCDTFKIDRA